MMPVSGGVSYGHDEMMTYIGCKSGRSNTNVLLVIMYRTWPIS